MHLTPFDSTGKKMDFKAVLQSVGLFLGSYIAIVVLAYILPSLLGALEGLVDYSLSGTILTVVIFIWVIMGIVLPSFKLYGGISENIEETKGVNIIVAAALIFFGVLLTINGGYMLTAMGNIITEPMVRTIFWIGTITLWAELFIITPLYLIVKSTNILPSE